MLLRDHPLMSYKGHKHPRGEVGILKGVVLSNINPTDRCFLYINYQQSTYTG
jgi:hypothetical protein